jgi:hypothetical protein
MPPAPPLTRLMSILCTPEPDRWRQGVELYRALDYPTLPPPPCDSHLVVHGSFLDDPHTARDIDYLHSGMQEGAAAARVLHWVAQEHGAGSALLQLPLDGRAGRTVPTWRSEPYTMHGAGPLYRCLHGSPAHVSIHTHRALSSKIREAAAVTEHGLGHRLHTALSQLEALYLSITGPEVGGYTADGPAGLRNAWRRLSAQQRQAALDALPEHWRPVWAWLIDAGRPPPPWLVSSLRRHAGAGGVLLHWSRPLDGFTGQHGGRLTRSDVLEAFRV